MTVFEVTGDLFDPDATYDAIGHGVNCFGLMGAGIAVKFREDYPVMYGKYKSMCDGGFLLPGMVMPYKPEPGINSYIYNIASQHRPGADARVEYLRAGLQWVRFHMEFIGLSHLGLPRIGAGIGGLAYADVVDTVNEVFSGSPVNVTIVSL